MSIITLTAHRTTSGRTTSAIHLAQAMSLMGLRTLLIDCSSDRQLSIHFGVKRDSAELASQAFLKAAGDISKISANLICAEVRKGLDIVPSAEAFDDPTLPDSEKLALILKIRTGFRLFARRYDAVILDTDEPNRLLSLAALSACSIIVTPLPARPGFGEAAELLERINPLKNVPQAMVLRNFVEIPLGQQQPIERDTQRVIIEDRLQLVNERNSRNSPPNELRWGLFSNAIPRLVSLPALSELHLTAFDLGDTTLSSEILATVQKAQTTAAFSADDIRDFGKAYMMVAEELLGLTAAKTTTKTMTDSKRNQPNAVNRLVAGLS